jgi:chromosomal replication initiation ATPase DnaA
MATAETILAEVATAYRMTVRDLQGPSRFKEIVAARRYAVARLWASGFSFPQISRLLNKHPSTINNHFSPKTREKKRLRYLAGKTS